jgi:hypothetical protein
MSESKKSVASENDPKKLEWSLEELLQAVDDEAIQSQVATHTTNRSFAIK